MYPSTSVPFPRCHPFVLPLVPGSTGGPALLSAELVFGAPRAAERGQRRTARSPLGAAAMPFLPDEARSLPPPPLVNKGSVWLGLTGWLAALLDNGFAHRPVLRAGKGRRG